MVVEGIITEEKPAIYHRVDQRRLLIEEVSGEDCPYRKKSASFDGIEYGSDLCTRSDHPHHNDRRFMRRCTDEQCPLPTITMEPPKPKGLLKRAWEFVTKEI